MTTDDQIKTIAQIFCALPLERSDEPESRRVDRAMDVYAYICSRVLPPVPSIMPYPSPEPPRWLSQVKDTDATFVRAVPTQPTV